jgi:hypothetical protein
MSATGFVNGVRHEPLAELVERRDEERPAEIILDHEAAEDEPKLLVFASRSNRGGTP